MNNALIGCTGFVGSNLIQQTKFDHLFNSSNISDLKTHDYSTLVIAAPSAVKWKANMEPENDLQIVNSLINSISGTKADLVIHISTIDVYQNPYDVDENTKIDTSTLHPYGKHRYLIEEFIRNNYENHLIVRLPGLFGTGLKKNFIFDMLNNNALNLTHKDSRFQLYDLSLLWHDINIALQKNIKLMNFSTEPTTASELAKEIFNVKFENLTDKPPANYNVKSVHYNQYEGANGYLYDKKKVFTLLKNFVSKYN